MTIEPHTIARRAAKGTPPYRGIGAQNQCYPSNPERPGTTCRDAIPNVNGAALTGLLAVGLQNLVAGRADLGTVLLQAGENGEIALINHRTAVLLHVAGAGLLLVRRSATAIGIGGRRKGKRGQGESEKKFTHLVPSF